MIYLARVICPSEHALIVVPWNCERGEAPLDQLEELSAAVAELAHEAVRRGGVVELKLRACGLRVDVGPPIAPWCPICGARDLSWVVKVEETEYGSLAQAQVVLDEQLRAQSETAAQVRQLRRRAAMN